MARPLDSIHSPPPDRAAPVDPPAVGKRLDRAAARAFAAAISSLIIATLVVSQSAQALDPEGTVAANSIAAGTITLVDDDQGRSMVQLSDMAPGRPAEECITVSYAGTILPVDVRLTATVAGELADYLWVDIERGTGSGFGSCDDFDPVAEVFSSSIGDLGRSDPLPVATFRNVEDDVTFRFRFEVLDDERAVGQAASIDVVWEAVPS